MDRTAFSKISLLYVEDDEDIRNELVEVLELEFKAVYVAKDGEEGLHLYKRHHPDIVVSDIQMPKMDGLEMCEEIRKIDSEIPIIITTAFNEPSFLIKSIDIGVDKYVVKPINIAKLEETLFRCSKFVFQNRKINDLIELSKQLMDKHDNFMFISGDEFVYINQSFLNFLGFGSVDEYYKNNSCIFEKLKGMSDEEIFEKKEKWVEFAKNNLDKEHIVYFKDCTLEEKKVVPYKVSIHYFFQIEHYLIVFDEFEEETK